ncbi:hypothetical protein OX283_008195 [Flavobacterium sp. SUN052]|uniref:hypothetical protein n=1 Tax=Flavobacterium sp. SUN052 TaxID=3002441 RepID=UPI00237E737A|nr:hypothetical protein [Flavobacterium sp. SUN052]MEC4004633.1 hypothetical protein [Flavobacterium sp. SUN052]
MRKIDLLIGFFVGIVVALIGAGLFLRFFTEVKTFSDLHIVSEQGILGKVITLGAVLNIAAFFLLLQMKKELMARGIVLATIILAIATLFI